MAPSRPRYSFVLPIFNEQETIAELYKRLIALLERLDAPAEVIMIDDGSRDKSYELLRDLQRKDNRIRLIRFGRNFGHQIAISAGMDFARGDATIIMDADLQDPPEVVLEMIARWKEGYEIVYGQRAKREGETFFKKLTAKAYYRLLGAMTDIKIPVDVGDFRLVDRKALEAFKAMREHHRFVRGMFAWVGFKQTSVLFNRPERFAGETKYPLRKMIALARDGVISFSVKPLRLALNMGFTISGFAFLYALYAIGRYFVGHTIEGWTSLAVVVAFLGGGQLIVMGILGEYIGRIHEEVKSRPLYIIRELAGFDTMTLLGPRALDVSGFTQIESK